jgi:hypothetical protein
MVLFVYLAFVALLTLLLRSGRRVGVNDLELLVLRHPCDHDGTATGRLRLNAARGSLAERVQSDAAPGRFPFERIARARRSAAALALRRAVSAMQQRAQRTARRPSGVHSRVS